MKIKFRKFGINFTITVPFVKVEMPQGDHEVAQEIMIHNGGDKDRIVILPVPFPHEFKNNDSHPLVIDVQIVKKNHDV